ncbi:hypothetical protein WR25_26251 [Diploscapter pachys]|uniref:GRAM domain-containing protein n=1 Tax=Diploscapter pachys TaxID=2018661 RepID=A0A2A2JSW0_9BILA|nr:hypothetical protein WR25_26251 [Diploscapter pachys]
MSLNNSHTPDGRGVLIYNGEMILLYTSAVKMSFSHITHPALKGSKTGALYLTTHRIIFMNNSHKEELRSFAMPFQQLRQVKLEQPLLAPNYLKGSVVSLPGGNFEGEVDWKLSFPKGGCVDFGQALLRAADLASNSRPAFAPPPYMPCAGTYYVAPPAYYIPPQGNYQGFQAPVHVFSEQPPAGNVFMYEAPPPYAGIGQPTVYPAGGLQYAGTAPPQYGFNSNVVGYPNGAPSQPASNPHYQNVPNVPPPYPGPNTNQQAGPLPAKN